MLRGLDGEPTHTCQAGATKDGAVRQTGAADRAERLSCWSVEGDSNVYGLEAVGRLSHSLHPASPTGWTATRSPQTMTLRPGGPTGIRFLARLHYKIRLQALHLEASAMSYFLLV